MSKKNRGAGTSAGEAPDTSGAIQTAVHERQSTRDCRYTLTSLVPSCRCPRANNQNSFITFILQIATVTDVCGQKRQRQSLRELCLPCAQVLTRVMNKQTDRPGELDVVGGRRPAGTSGILARLQQELSAARSRNAAAEIFCTAERVLSEDDLESFIANYVDILHELPE
jgi:hypothetical protein